MSIGHDALTLVKDVKKFEAQLAKLAKAEKSAGNAMLLSSGASKSNCCIKNTTVTIIPPKRTNDGVERAMSITSGPTKQPK